MNGAWFWASLTNFAATPALASAKANLTDGFGQILEMCLQFQRESASSQIGNPAGTKTPTPLYLRTTASERVKGKQIAAGTAYELLPATFGDDSSWYTLVVLQVADDELTKRGQREEAFVRKAQGSITQEDFLTLQGVTNVSKYQDELELDTWKAMMAKPEAALAFARATRLQASLTGVNETAIVAALNGAPVQAGPGEPLLQPGGQVSSSGGPSVQVAMPGSAQAPVTASQGAPPGGGGAP